MKYFILCLVSFFSLVSFSYSESSKTDAFQKGLQQFLGKDIKGAIATMSSIPKTDAKFEKAQNKIKEWQGMIDKEDKMNKLKASVKYGIVKENLTVKKEVVKGNRVFPETRRIDVVILVNKDIADDALEALCLVLKEKYASYKFVGIDICDENDAATLFSKGDSYMLNTTDSEFKYAYSHLRGHYGKDALQHFFSFYKDGKDYKMIKY